jgi:Fic family protein
LRGFRSDSDPLSQPQGNAKMPKKKKKAKAKKSKPAKFIGNSARKRALKPASNRSKSALVIELLERSGGVSVTELASKTGWQPHTCRAKISVLGKSVAIEKSKNKSGDLVYRKVGSTAQAATSKR